MNLAPVTGLIIPVDDDYEIRTFVPDVDALQAAIGGGPIQVVALPGAFLYVDEEGKLKHQPVNGPATLFARRLGWRAADVLVGTVLVLGPSTRDGRDTSVRVSVLELWRELMETVPGE